MKGSELGPMVRTRGAGRPYDAGDRARVVEHAIARRREGAGIGAIAREVGVSSTTLYEWLREPRFEAVEIVGRVQRGEGLVVHGPHGVRVEGLSVAELADLLRRLG